jgi:protein arginine N-methyltransferase 1
MYSIHGYGSMIADDVRMSAYQEALRRVVRPDTLLLDLGCGTGIFALLACRLGARHVYAIESSDVIETARQTAAANGFEKRITFLQGNSTRIELPERVHAVVSDIRGVLPLFQHSVLSIADARKRLCVPGAVLIPQVDALWAAVVQAEKAYGEIANPWEGDHSGLNLRPALPLATNAWSKQRFAPEELVTEPRRWAVMDYRTIESPDVCGDLAWEAVRGGAAHGLCLWFESSLVEGVSFSNAPGAPRAIYGQGFFPWSAPVPLEPGDAVAVRLGAHLVGDDYVWRWESKVTGAAGLKAQFRQSNFYGAPLSLASLRKRAGDFVPLPDEEGEIDRFILSQMDGRATLAEIAARLAGRFPARFADAQAALTRVGELSQKYSR